MSDIEKVYCPLPFKALAFKEFVNGKLSGATPCCMMLNTIDNGFENTHNRFKIDGVENMTPLEIFNSSRMNQLRQNIINGKRDSACKVCWQAEDRGIKSFRQFMKADEIIFEPVLKEIDISISNVCNLACRMCVPTNSNLLQKDHKFFVDNGLEKEIVLATNGRWFSSYPYDGSKSVQWQWIVHNIDQITTLKMSGGEPFYDKKVLELLELCVEKGLAENICLEFHTNTTCFDDKLISLLKKFKNKHTFSIDGVDKVYEYIRYPAKFEQLDKSLKLYIDNIVNRTEIIHINFVVSALNLFNVIDFLNYVDNLDTKYHVFFSEVFPNTRGIGIRHLDYNLLDQAHKMVIDNFDRFEKESVSRLEQVIRNAKDKCMPSKNLLLKEINLFDASRNQSYKDFLSPEIKQWLDS